MSLPQNVIDELKAWLSDVSQTWQYKNSGETGIDIGMHGKIDNPVYSVSSGTVVGSGYYGGGGVVSIKSNINYGGINGPASIYYQHLDQVLVPKGAQIYQGELIGLSGGQLSGGSHPSSRKYSSGPHIEIGINAPYGQANKSIWSPLGQNVNPLGFFQSLLAGNTNILGIGSGDPCANDPTGLACIASTIATGVAGTAGNTGNVLGMPAQQFQSAISNAVGGLFNTAGSNLNKATGISSISDFLWRAGLLIISFTLIVIGFMVIAKDLAPTKNIDISPSEIAALAAAG